MQDDGQPNDGLEPLLEYLRRTRGFDFTAYKRTSLRRRILKRMQMVGIASIADYNDYLEVHAEEFEPLFNTILINVTSFFRDAEVWDFLWHQIVPRILAEKQPDEFIRVWSAGCSTGEEAYSLAIILAELLGPGKLQNLVKIYATDADNEALAVARHAVYPPRQLQELPEPLKARYFEPHEGRYVFGKDLRRAVIFGKHDLIQDAPISKIDLLLCRNTLMYFNVEAQSHILDRFAFATRQGGFLVLGKAEMLLNRDEKFTAVDIERRVFMHASQGMYRHINGGERELMEHSPVDPLANRIFALALERDALPQIAVDRGGTLLLANETARSLFGLRPEDLRRPLQELHLAWRPVELRPLIEQAVAERRVVSAKDVEWPTPSGSRKFFDVDLIPLFDGESDLIGAKVTFTDITSQRRIREELQQSQVALQATNEKLQSANEALETANEELQSTVEELETTNEELQSTNEELETLNEELQSTNEEMEATNEQLRERSDEAIALNAFLESVLGSLRDAVIAVDKELRVTAWNQRAEELWGLRSGEVRGKHLMNLDIGLPVENLRRPLRTCMWGDGNSQVLSLEAMNRRGKPIQVNITCSPLLTGADLHGAIILIADREINFPPTTPAE